MLLAEYLQRLSEFAATVNRWLATAVHMDSHHREKAALYAEEIAATLARATAALVVLEAFPDDRRALLSATRELARISGYIEPIVASLGDRLDGRKRASVKRRLETLKPFDLEAALQDHGAFRQARRMASAEGYFRALADTLRA